MLSLFTWVLLPLRRLTQMRTKEPWTLKSSQCFTRWCPCVEICTCCCWATVTRRIISLWRSWLSFWGWSRRYGNVCIHVWGHALAFRCKERILLKISLGTEGKAQMWQILVFEMLLERVWAALDDFWSGFWRIVVWEGAQGPGAGRGTHLGVNRTLWTCWGSRKLELSVGSGILHPPCALWALLPSAGRSGRFPWMFPVPATPLGRAALPQKLILLPARRQLPSALTQTASCFCCCLDAWKSVDSLFCSICCSFGKMWNILQPEDTTKEGWGFC